ncbi:transcriptional regulator [Aureimonas populi]|uniref:Transcriptional regulator n=1 Tax=Aureimonas populi TaxID=1701758 RepID=A0ABW5CMY3_9HYPH|nr:transcriptional regulator [Aureimonas populi]
MGDLLLSPDLEARIESLARRSRRSAAEVVADALVNGHSLDWQEDFLRRVGEGIEAADAGRFASEEELSRVRGKYGSRHS